MKILAKMTSFGCQGAASDDQATVVIQYSCGDRGFDSGVQTTLDLTRTEAQLQEDIRAAVSADANSAHGSSTTAADVRLI